MSRPGILGDLTLSDMLEANAEAFAAMRVARRRAMTEAEGRPGRDLRPCPDCGHAIKEHSRNCAIGCLAGPHRLFCSCSLTPGEARAKLRMATRLLGGNA